MKEKQITIFYNNIYTIEVDLKSTGKYIQHHFHAMLTAMEM